MNDQTDAAAAEEATAFDLVETTDVTSIFTGKTVDQLLSKLEKEVRSFAPDLSSAKGRKEIASLAYRVSRSKTELDKAGKAMTESARKEIEAVNAERKKIETRLDALRDEVRKPLNDWEAAEEKRKADLRERLTAFHDRTDWSMDSEAIAAILAEVEAIDIDESWQEFTTMADEAKLAAVKKMRADLTAAKGREDQAAELARLRTEAAEREAREATERQEREAKERQEREEREAKIAAEDAERKAKADAEEAERKKKADAEEAERQAKRDAEDAERKAVDDARAAEQAKIDEERKRKDDEQRAIADRLNAEHERAEQMIDYLKEVGNGMIGGEVQPFGILIYELEKKIQIDDQFGAHKAALEVLRDTMLTKLKDAMASQKDDLVVSEVLPADPVKTDGDLLALLRDTCTASDLSWRDIRKVIDDLSAWAEAQTVDAMVASTEAKEGKS
jgi:septal ring factor EnvC (AmiA/AmiB activator)